MKRVMKCVMKCVMKRKLYESVNDAEESLLQNCTGPLELVHLEELDWYKNRVILFPFLPLCCTKLVVEYLVEFRCDKLVKPTNLSMWKKFQGCWVKKADGSILDLCSTSNVSDCIQKETLSILPWQPLWEHRLAPHTFFYSPATYDDTSSFMGGMCYDISLEITKSDQVRISSKYVGALDIYLEGKWILGCKREVINVFLIFSKQAHGIIQSFFFKQR